MVNDYKHLNIVLNTSGKKKTPRRRNFQEPVEVSTNKNNRVIHSQYLSAKGSDQLVMWNKIEQNRIQDQLPKLPTDKPLLVRISPDEVNLDFFRSSLKMEVVCEYDDGIVIVASDPDDFNDTINKIHDFANAIKGSGSIAHLCDIIVEETNTARINRILSEDILSIWDSLKTNRSQRVTVCVGIECQGKIVISPKPEKKEHETDEKYAARLERWNTKCAKAYEDWDALYDERSDQIIEFVNKYGGDVLDISEDGGMDAFDMKIVIPVCGLIDFIENYPYVFEASFPDDFDSENFINMISDNNTTPFEINSPDEHSATVCIIDSGVQESHSYIEKAINNGLSKSYLKDDLDTTDKVPGGGHGTRVAGAILYPNGIQSINDNYTLPCFIANARVLNDAKSMPDDLFPPKVTSAIIQDYTENNIRIFSQSINTRVPYKKKHMSAWPATIDNWCYQKDILFIQSAGNINKSYDVPIAYGIQQHLEAERIYPTYLDEKSCNISSPAQSLLALTVGSICCGKYEDADLVSFGETGAISSFSRSGFGIWNSIKPEVVEFGGDYVRSKHNNNTFRIKEETCPELIRSFPDGPAYAKDAIGTSFAAPKVANIAAELEKLFPTASSLLYKTLIIQSARWTNWAEGIEPYNALKYMGYGLVNLERAVINTPYRFTCITDSPQEICGNYIQIYKVSIPNEIRSLDNKVRIDVTLSFASQPRRTRKGFKRYFATWVDWTCSRFNEDAESFSNRIIESDDDEIEENATTQAETGSTRTFSWTIGAQDTWGKIKGISRNNSATQKDWTYIKAYELPKEFCIAVRGHYGWSKNVEDNAKYALAISFEAIENDLEIYEQFEAVNQIQTETTV